MDEVGEVAGNRNLLPDQYLRQEMARDCQKKVSEIAKLGKEVGEVARRRKSLLHCCLIRKIARVRHFTRVSGLETCGRVDYLHDIPCRKGLVRYPEDWRASSRGGI